MLFKIEPRAEPSRQMSIAAPLIATGLTIVVSSLFFLSLGYNPLVTLYTFFIEPLTTMNGISEWLLKASPLILIACGLAIGFRANVWNIGAEGQLIMGAIAATGVGLFAPWQDSPLLLPSMVIAGMLAGMAWAAVPAFLKDRMNTNEILVTLMLTYVATLILSYLVHGPWRDPDGYNFPQTALLPYNGMFEVFDYSYRLNTSIFFTVVVVAITWLFTERSFLGYKMSVGGVAPAAARFAGFNASASIWIGLLASGAAAGLAGMMEAAGPLGQLSPQISPGYGFAAIIVAFVGRLNALGIVLGGLLLSLLYLGGETVQMSLGLPSSIALIFQGMLLFFLLASNFLINFRIRKLAMRTA
ncbi:ABC transporter permease [Mameliella alba]|uniref:ABC transporter permease n=2 Tax=Mameliella alba TaxID=561184 RepID=UPI00087EEC20|nr:ABC transporter permease [Mameliella alba]OWV44416.1 ABC transporter permease [Mameliella alba]OWV48826.1 ABC transporter permease [Mameliella alba]OWV65174.1 ABC transporter permease [Mameliella alba]PTR39404.1 simple sugar transport system permease protein [Mameliella alba]SDD33503.1 simple sugar transport system permease protein [Mameliella alba]